MSHGVSGSPPRISKEGGQTLLKLATHLAGLMDVPNSVKGSKKHGSKKTRDKKDKKPPPPVVPPNPITPYTPTATPLGTNTDGANVDRIAGIMNAVNERGMLIKADIKLKTQSSKAGEQMMQ